MSADIEQIAGFGTSEEIEVKYDNRSEEPDVGFE